LEEGTIAADPAGSDEVKYWSRRDGLSSQEHTPTLIIQTQLSYKNWRQTTLIDAVMNPFISKFPIDTSCQFDDLWARQAGRRAAIANHQGVEKFSSMPLPSPHKIRN